MATNANDILEIPGFYYDPERKKYFRILPEINNVNSGVITRRHVQEKKDYATFSSGEYCLNGNANRETGSFQLSRQRSRNVVHYMDSRCNGVQDPVASKRGILMQVMSSLTLQGSASISGPETLDDVDRTTQLLLSADQSRMLLLSASNIQKIHLWRLGKRKSRNPKKFFLKTSFEKASYVPTSNKLSNICWVTGDNTSQNETKILYGVNDLYGNRRTIVRLDNLEPDSVVTEYKLGMFIVWCCSWNATTGQNFAVGAEKCALLVDVASGKISELWTKKSDPMSQTFGHNASSFLYNGTRRGDIFGHDLRSQSTKPVFHVSQEKALCHLYATHDQFYLLASDATGKINRWDIRRKKVCTEYKGMSSNYSMTAFQICDQEAFMCSSGDDHLTRVWDYRTGQLLCTLLPPPPPSGLRSDIPATCISTCLGGESLSYPGVIQAVADKLYFYLPINCNV